jgi:hypothetical protein
VVLTETNIVQVLSSHKSMRAFAHAYSNSNFPRSSADSGFEKGFLNRSPKFSLIPVAPTREFCVALLESKVKATIRNMGAMIGWESDIVTVGPVAAAAI